MDDVDVVVEVFVFELCVDAGVLGEGEYLCFECVVVEVVFEVVVFVG